MAKMKIGIIGLGFVGGAVKNWFIKNKNKYDLFLYDKYKNIGVRIEDDMLVTETGVEWMSGKLPRTIADIEAFMAVAPKQVPLSKRMPSSILLNNSYAYASPKHPH